MAKEIRLRLFSALIVAQFFLYNVVFCQSERKCLVKGTAGSNDLISRITSSSDNGQLVFIPVVVHVVFSSPDQNISDDQIRSQLKVLNEDYNRKNIDTTNTLDVFKPLAGNAHLNFFLATSTINGDLTSGITRTQTNHGVFFNEDINYSNLGGKDAWPSTQFLNIWVCDLADGIFGYGSPPGTDINTDGVVIDYRYFGTINKVVPYEKGRTATHEIGHWLGLKHLWGDAGGCSDDDGIADTPMQAGPSSGCDLSKASCGALNMVQNYMDLSDDGCMNLFTKGQVNLMRDILFNKRSGVIIDMITEVKRNPEVKIVRINDGHYHIESEEAVCQIKIIDATAREIYFRDFRDIRPQEVDFDVKNISGIFFVLVSTSSSLFVERILK